MCRVGWTMLVAGLEEDEEEAIGVPARDAAAEDGFVGETDPPLERCDEFQPLPSLVGEELVEDGMVGGVSSGVVGVRCWLAVVRVPTGEQANAATLIRLQLCPMACKMMRSAARACQKRCEATLKLTWCHASLLSSALCSFFGVAESRKGEVVLPTV